MLVEKYTPYQKGVWVGSCQKTTPLGMKLAVPFIVDLVMHI